MKSVTVLQVEDPLKHDDFFPMYGFVYVVALKGVYTSIANSYYQLEKMGITTDRKVIAFNADRKNYRRAATLSECITSSIGGVYYIDSNDEYLYIHFHEHKAPEEFKLIYIGIALGFIKTEYFEQGFDDIYLGRYQHRLISAPAPGSYIDDPVFIEQKFQSAKFTIDNTDSGLKQFNIGVDEEGNIKRNKTGNLVRVSHWLGEGEPTYQDIEGGIFYTGYIDKVTEGQFIEINAIDARKKLDISGPGRLLDNTNWPDLASDREHILNEIWGYCDSVPVLCLNEKETYSDPEFLYYKFLLADSSKRKLHSITASYQDGQAIDLGTGGTEIKYDEYEKFAYIEVSKTVFPDGKGVNKVTLDVKGYVDASSTLIENTLDVAKEIINDSTNTEYNDVFYNTTQWNTVRASGRKTGYFLSRPRKLSDKIGDLQKNMPGTNFKIGLDGRYTWEDYRYIDRATSVGFKIRAKDRIDNGKTIPEIDSDASRVVAVARINYQTKYSEKEKLYEEYDTNKLTALDKYNSEITEPYDTALGGDQDLTSYANDVLAVNGFAIDTFKITVSSELEYNGTSISEKKAGDYIDVEMNAENKAYLNWVVAQILEIKLNDKNNYEIEFLICYKEPDNFRKRVVIGYGNTLLGIGQNIVIGE